MRIFLQTIVIALSFGVSSEAKGDIVSYCASDAIYEVPAELLRPWMFPLSNNCEDSIYVAVRSSDVAPSPIDSWLFISSAAVWKSPSQQMLVFEPYMFATDTLSSPPLLEAHLLRFGGPDSPPIREIYIPVELSKEVLILCLVEEPSHDGIVCEMGVQDQRGTPWKVRFPKRHLASWQAVYSLVEQITDDWRKMKR